MAAAAALGGSAAAAGHGPGHGPGHGRGQGQSNSDWSAYLDGPLHDSFNPSAVSINPADMADLQPIWQWNAPTSPNTGSIAELASPIVSDGVVYVGLNDGYMYAISEATQQVLWSQFIGLLLGTTCGPSSEGIASTATVAVDPQTGQRTVYVNAPNGYLYALDAATGAVEWQSVVGIPSTTENNYYAWGSPTVANGKVYIGISSRCDQPLVPAGVLAFDQSSGQQLAYWDSLPAGRIGASVWSSIAVLPDGNVIATTGNAGGAQTPEAESVSELNGSTLQLMSTWEIPAADQVTDSDFGGSPTVFTGYPGGVRTLMVGACNKDGIYFAFNANDIAAGPVWETRIGSAAGVGLVQYECDAAAIWNGHYLIEGGGSPVTINNITYNGSVQALNPTTGQVIWETGLPGYVVGSASEDGAGIVAAPVYGAAGPTELGVYLLSARTGQLLNFLSTGPKGDFAQPVFDQGDLLVGALGGVPLTAYAVTLPGQATPITLSSKAGLQLNAGQSATLTITGTGGFTAPANVIISGASVLVESVQITSSTTAVVKVVVRQDAPPGQILNVTLVEPGQQGRSGNSPSYTAYWCTGCLAIG